MTAAIARHDDRVRVQVDLVDVQHDRQIWGSRYEARKSELIDLKARILQDLPRALGVEVSDREKRQLPDASPRAPRHIAPTFKAAMNGAGGRKPR